MVTSDPLVLLAFPLLTAALFALPPTATSRPRLRPGQRRCPAVAAPVLVLRHPEVYIIALPFFASSPRSSVFSRKPIFGYTTLIYARWSSPRGSIAVWAHHMYATGACCCRSSRS